MVAMFVAIIGMIDRFFNFGNYHWSLRRAFGYVAIFVALSLIVWAAW